MCRVVNQGIIDMSLYKSYVPKHTCDRCGEHIEEGELMWSDGINVLCEKCVNDDYDSSKNDNNKEE